MSNQALINLADAQAIYMSYLVEQATELALYKGKKDKLAFDPQGRVLIDVDLTEAQLQELIKKIQPSVSNADLTRDKLNELLGLNTTPTTTVSLDIKKIPELHTLFNDKLSESLRAYLNEGTTNTKETTILNAVNNQSLGSIIALQQEFHFHLALATRLYQKGLGIEQDKQFKEVHKKTMLELNELVMNVYAKALITATNGGTQDINVAQLNKILDKARKKIASEAHMLLKHNIIEKTINELEPLRNLASSTLRHFAESTTATPNDVLHTDNYQGLATWIAGSENTAHHRVPGKEFAHRQILTLVIDEEQTIKPQANARLQIRTPTPAVKDEPSFQTVGFFKNQDNYISDVSFKLNVVNEEHKLKERLNINSSIPSAFIYNSFTAINYPALLDGSNRQTQSAEHVLKGAHQYNVAQRTTHHEKPVYCFVHNSSVNGFGSSLGYSDSNNALTTETTLMAEMAILHTLYDGVSENEKTKIEELFNLYTAFLDDDTRKPYFSQSEEGLKAIVFINDIKSDLRATPSTQDESFIKDVKNALKFIFANDLHHSHEFSKLIQTLSIFVEEVSISGCKSGNERAQAIYGRVAILDSVLKNTDNEENMEAITIKKLVALLATPQLDPKEVVSKARDLKDALDTRYNETNLQGGLSLISLVDQGFTSKIDAAATGVFGFLFNWNTNRAEESSLSNLSQSEAGKLQAHKGAVQFLQDALKGNPISWWSRMKSSPLGTFGGILGVICAPVAIAVYFYSSWDNTNRKLASELKESTLFYSAVNDQNLKNFVYRSQALKKSYTPDEVPEEAADLQDDVKSTATASTDAEIEEDDLTPPGRSMPLS